MCIDVSISFLIFYVSFFYAVDRNDGTIGDECVSFFNYRFVDVFVCNSLYSIGNELDSWVVIWVGNFA